MPKPAASLSCRQTLPPVAVRRSSTVPAASTSSRPSGVEVPRPTLPRLLTKSEWLGASQRIVNGIVAEVTSSIEKLLRPPVEGSFEVRRQSVEAKPAVVLVSSNSSRVLLCFSFWMSVPKSSPAAQSMPMQAFPPRSGPGKTRAARRTRQAGTTDYELVSRRLLVIQEKEAGKG